MTVRSENSSWCTEEILGGQNGREAVIREAVTKAKIKDYSQSWFLMDS